MGFDNAVALWNENAGTVYNAREYRRWLEKMLGLDLSAGTLPGGVFRSPDLQVQALGTPNMTVNVTAGGAAVKGSQSATQGAYFAYNDAVVNVPITPADSVNPRADLVGIRIQDKEYGDAVDQCAVVPLTGVPAGSPVEPTWPNNFLPLARIDVPAAVTSITTGRITDRRRLLSGMGGVIVCTSTTRPTLNLWAGMLIYETDTGLSSFYDGTTWQPIGQSGRSWTVIQDIVLGADGPVVFSAIPQTFRHLKVICTLRTAGVITVENVYIRFNNDSGANYNYEYLQGNNAAVGAGATAAATYILFSTMQGSTGIANAFGTSEIDIPDYANTTRHKTCHSSGGTHDTGNGLVLTAAGRWASTAAINRIDLTTGGALIFKAGSVATLLGIR